jgi:transporter family-2 protein
VLGSPFRATLVSFVTGTIVVLLVVLVAARGGFHRTGAVPWWGWLGGLCGAFYVTAAIVVPPRLGVTQFFAIFVAAQLAFSVLVDRFGWLGFDRDPPGAARLAGVALLVFGALLVRLG